MGMHRLLLCSRLPYTRMLRVPSIQKKGGIPLESPAATWSLPRVTWSLPLYVTWSLSQSNFDASLIKSEGDKENGK